MGRAKNIETRERISKTAIRLFSEKGYVNTSFTDIAKACGVERSIVQYYFPYKEIFITEFLDKCLMLIAEMAEGLDEKRFDIFGRQYFMGFVSFSFLVDSEKMQNLTMDIVASRQLTEAMMPLYCRWDQWFSGEDFDEDATMLAIGGVYELIYHYKKNNLKISSRYLAEQCYVAFTACHGQNPEEARRKLEEYCLTDEEVKSAVAKVEQELFD